MHKARHETGSSVQYWLGEAAARLAAAGSDSAAFDAQLLLARAMRCGRSAFFAWPEAEVGQDAAARFLALLEQREAGMPVAYLLGEKGFWCHTLRVSPAVLIPRPETELLVETALELCEHGQACVADLGTGSGAIALALAGERPEWRVYATEIDEAALEVARDNAARLKPGNVSWLQGSWCSPLPDLPFDLIVSNPPYIDAADPHLQQGDVRFEPRRALVSAEQGIADIRSIAEQACAKLAPGAWLLLEHGWRQGAQVRALLRELGYGQVATRQDLAGHDRVTTGRKAAGVEHG